MFLRSASQSGAFAVDHNLQTLNSSSTQITCKSLPPTILPKTATAKLFLIHHLATSFLLPNPPSANLQSTVQYSTTMPFSVPLMSTSYLSTWWWFRCDIFQTPTKSRCLPIQTVQAQRRHISPRLCEPSIMRQVCHHRKQFLFNSKLVCAHLLFVCVCVCVCGGGGLGLLAVSC